jgi:hypothetical protein
MSLTRKRWDLVMRSLLQKFKNKEFVQNILVELIGDIIMIVLGIVAGYYVKAFIIR